MRNFLKSAGIAGLVVAAGLAIAPPAPAAAWVSVGESWGWHRPYWGWPRPVYVRPAPIYVPGPVYVREPVYVPMVRSEPRLNYVLDELGHDASRIDGDRAAGRISASGYDSLMAEDSSIRAQAVHSADVHGWLPDPSYYHLQSEVSGLGHDISHLAG